MVVILCISVQSRRILRNGQTVHNAFFYVSRLSDPVTFVAYIPLRRKTTGFGANRNFALGGSPNSKFAFI